MLQKGSGHAGEALCRQQNEMTQLNNEPNSTQRLTMNALLKTTIRRLPYLVLGGTLLVAGATAAVNKGDSKTETKPSPIKLVVDERPVTRDVRLGTSFRSDSISMFMSLRGCTTESNM